MRSIHVFVLTSLLLAFGFGCGNKATTEGTAPGAYSGSKGGPSGGAEDAKVSADNLKKIGVAMLVFQDSNGHFPSASPQVSKGRQPAPVPMPLVSWRVQILHSIDKDLYEKFKLNEPWDSPNNKKLIEHMPKIFQSPTAVAPPGETYYKVFTGDDTIFMPGYGGGLGEAASRKKNKILVVEGGDPVIWTKPDEIIVDPKNPLPDLSLKGNRTINVLMADGSTVTHINLDKVSEKTLKAAIFRAGGETLDEDWPK
jgi:hypothetical protein